MVRKWSTGPISLSYITPTCAALGGHVADRATFAVELTRYLGYDLLTPSYPVFPPPKRSSAHANQAVETVVEAYVREEVRSCPHPVETNVPSPPRNPGLGSHHNCHALSRSHS
jgi:hypothetical protein